MSYKETYVRWLDSPSLTEEEWQELSAIENDEKDVQLVALILGIAKNLDIPVIAEGVETEQQLKLLKDLGCVLAQGYFFSRPLHPAEFEEKYLRDGERAP